MIQGYEKMIQFTTDQFRYDDDGIFYAKVVDDLGPNFKDNYPRITLDILNNVKFQLTNPKTGNSRIFEYAYQMGGGFNRTYYVYRNQLDPKRKLTAFIISRKEKK